MSDMRLKELWWDTRLRTMMALKRSGNDVCSHEQAKLEFLRHCSKKVAIFPMFSDGRFDLDSLSAIRCAVSCVFGLPSLMMPPIRLPEHVFRKTDGVVSIDGDQFIIFMQKRAKVERFDRSIVVTDLAVGTDSFGWVHGYAGLRDKTSIVSTSRIRANVYENLRKVAVHELAHTFGVPHCRNVDCIMHPVTSGGLAVVPSGFCAICTGRLLAVSERDQNEALSVFPLAIP